VAGPDRAALTAVDRIAAAAFAADAQPGLVYGVVDAREDPPLVHSAGLGRLGVAADDHRVPDADSVFRIASMTKSFTAALLVLLRDQGSLALDDPVARYLPELADLRLPTTDSPALTVRHLLTMSGGLPTDDPWGDRQQSLPADDFSALLRGGFSFAWPPGVRFEYSNLGYAILGRVAEAAGGGSYRTLLTDRLLRPLNLTATGFEAQTVRPDRLATGHLHRDGDWLPVPFDGYGAFAPMGGLVSTVRDLAGWVAGFARAFPPRDGDHDGHPLSRASRREQQQQHRGIPLRPGFVSVDLPAPQGSAGYGFGLVGETHPSWGEIVQHSGGYPGFGSHMRWHPATGLGVVVLGNSTYAPMAPLGARLLDSLLESVEAAGPGRARRPAVTPWPRTLAAQRTAEELLTRWDDQLAAGLFAMNVDLDEPVGRRAAAVARAVDWLGPFEPDRSTAAVSDTPAHRRWWMRGRGGRLQLELRLTPQRPPRVQTLTVTPVGDPVDPLRPAVLAVLTALNTDHSLWPGRQHGLAVPAGESEPELTRLLRSAAAWAGPCTLGSAVAGDGRLESTVRLTGRRASLLLTLAMDDTGRLTRVTLRPDPDHLPSATAATRAAEHDPLAD
jgi:CubicO group peptidase (beta-lactamase class C family)